MTIPQRILLQVGLGAALVITVATGVTYEIVYREARDRDLDHLQSYVRERARREGLGFQQVQANLALVRGQFLRRMEGPLPRNIDGQWNDRFLLFPDGAWRSRTNFVDSRKYSTLWAHKNAAFTPELKAQVLRAQNICDDLLPGWMDNFPSVYFIFPGGTSWLNIGFDSRIPNWVWDTPADYDPGALEWFQLALPTNRVANGARSAAVSERPAAAATNATGASETETTANALRLGLRPQPRFDVTAWTGVIEEPTTKVPIVSVYLPIETDGKFFGSVGHDLFVNRLLDETTHSDLPGTMHVIFRADGRLIAHPTKRKEILASKGALRMTDTGDAALASLYRTVRARGEDRFSGFDEASGLYFSAARLAGPEWFFVTTVPRELLQQLAFQSAQWVLWSGLASLALVLGVLAAILRRQVARPLAELTRATRQISAGEATTRATVERDDELGVLASAFNEMSAKVRERDETLRAERDGLELRVTERVHTIRLNAEVAVVLNQDASLAAMLKQCCESLVRNLDAAFARVWILNERDATLELAASSGLYTHLDGPHSRIPLGQFKIGRIAQEKAPHLTNAVQTDPRVSDPEWARREGMVAFAGYPLLVEGRVIGVMGLFARHSLSDETLGVMAQVADTIALGIRRKTTESRLLESEARFFTTFQHSPAMQSLIRAADKTIVEVNDTFLQKLGLTREKVIGKTPFDLHLWSEPASLAAYAQELETKGFVQGHEVRFRTTDGRALTALLSSHPVDIGGVPHFLSAGVDITARKEAEEKLREGEARLRALYESLSSAVVVHDETGFLQANSAAARMFGASRPEELIGLNPTHTSARSQPNGEDSATAARRHITRALEEGTHGFEWLGRRLDGTEFPVEVTLTALPLEGRTVIQAVMHDLTERRRAEAELQNALVKERELSQLKSEFVSLVSHEFRTPLEIIMSSADNLQRYHDRLEAEQRDHLLRTINKSVRRMSGMMEEVLVLGRLESDRMTFKPEGFDLRVFCQRVCDEIQSATSGRCPIRLAMDGVFGDATGDENVLRHIFANLLSNAVKYSPEGSEVGFTVTRETDVAVCIVVDRGCGIPQADQKRLFEAFHRGSNVGQIPGTGLGLLIVQRCVALHGGELTFVSAEGKGTTFTVRLPMFNQPTPKP